MGDSIDEKFRNRYGERGYTPFEIEGAISSVNFILHYGQMEILDCALQRGVAVDLFEEGIISKRVKVGCLIKESDLKEIIKGLNIPISKQELVAELKR